MADFDNTNRGSLFKEENKKTEKSPDFSGNLNVEGKEYKISAWTKESKAGKKFLSLSVQEKNEQGAAPVKKATENDDWGI